METAAEACACWAGEARGDPCTIDIRLGRAGAGKDRDNPEVSEAPLCFVAQQRLSERRQLEYFRSNALVRSEAR